MGWVCERVSSVTASPALSCRRGLIPARGQPGVFTTTVGFVTFHRFQVCRLQHVTCALCCDSPPRFQSPSFRQRVPPYPLHPPPPGHRHTGLGLRGLSSQGVVLRALQPTGSRTRGSSSTCSECGVQRDEGFPLRASPAAVHRPPVPPWPRGGLAVSRRGTPPRLPSVLLARSSPGGSGQRCFLPGVQTPQFCVIGPQWTCF